MPAIPVADKGTSRTSAAKVARGDGPKADRPGGTRSRSTKGPTPAPKRGLAKGGRAPGAAGGPRRGKPSARTGKAGPQAVQAHFRRFPPHRRQAMLRLWALVQEALPGSSAVVSYGIAIASVGDRWVAGVGSGKAHVGLYLMSPPFVKEHAKDLAGLDVSGGTVRFPLEKPLPAFLVQRLVRARLVALGQQYGADEARRKPLRAPPKRAPAPKPAPLDRFPKPMVVPLDKPQ